MFSLTRWLSSNAQNAQRRAAQRPRPTIKRQLFRPGLEDLEHRITPATITWSGALSSDWNVPGNWVGGVVPKANDDLVFNAAGLNGANMNNNLAGSGAITFNSITFSSGGYSISLGRDIRLTAGLTNTAGVNTFNVDIALGGAQVFNIIDGQVVINGDVSGAATASIAKTGAGILTYNGNNTYTGATTVFGGVLQLNDTTPGANPNAINGALIINAGAGLAATVELLASNQILNSVNVSILNGGILDLNGNLEQIAGLTLTGGNVNIDGGGILTLTGNVTTTASTFVSAINGPGTLTLAGTGTRTFTVADGTVADDLVVTATINATAGLTKTGAGLMALSAANAYTGVTTVSAGILEVRNASALGAGGTSGNRTSVSAGATVQLANGVDVGNELLSLAGTLSSLAGNTTWAGNITLVANSIIDVDAGTLFLTGLISGSFGVTKVGAGTVQYNGTVSNTYTGTTRVNEGTLELNMFGLNALANSGALIIGDGIGGADADQVVLHQNDQIPNNKPITVNSSGLLNLNGFNDTTGTITLAGGHINTNGGTLTLAGHMTTTASTVTALIEGRLDLGASSRQFTVAEGGADPDLRIAALVTGNVGLIKAGAGKLALTNANTYTGATIVTGGTLEIQNSQALGAAGTAQNGTTVNSGATLSLNSVAGFTVNNEFLTLNGAGVGGGGALRNQAGNNTYNGPITLATSSSIFVQADQLTVSGVIAGGSTRTLTKSGAGTLILTNANTYAGGTVVSQGVLNIRNAAALGAGTGATANGTTVSSGAQLQIQGGINVLNERLTLRSAGPGGTGGLQNVLNDNTWSGVVFVDSASTVNVLGAAESLTFSNVVSGDSRLTKTGPGTLIFSGAASNTSTGGTTVAEGTLELNKAGTAVAIASSLIIGDNVGADDTARVVYNAAAGTNQIANTVPVTVNDDGLLDLGTETDTIGALNLGGGRVTNTGAGALTLNGNVTGTGSAATSLVEGRLNLGGSTRTFNIADGAAVTDVQIDALIDGTGSAGITKTGAGVLVLNAANDYDGTTTVSAGTLVARNNLALGTIAAGTTVATAGTLLLDNNVTINEALTLAGGTLFSVAANTWTGVITVTANSTINAAAGTLNIDNTVNLRDRILTVTGAGNVDVDNPIVGAGGRLVKAGAGTLDVSAASTYTGGTTVNGGTLVVSNGGTGSALGTGAVAVNNTGLLTGVGRFTGALNVAAGGQVDPGATNAVGTLATGAATFQPGAIFAPDLEDIALPDPSADILNVTGLVRLNNATLAPNVISAPDLNVPQVIIQNDGTDAVIGTFLGLAEGATFGAGGFTFQISYIGGTGNDVTLTQVTNVAPTINGASDSAIDDDENVNPFAAVVIGDANSPPQTVSVTVTLADSALPAVPTDDNGTLTGGGFVHAGAGVYVLNNVSAAAATTAIQALLFTPTDNQVAPGGTVTTIFTIDVTDGALSHSDNTTEVDVLSVNDAPVLTGLVSSVTYAENTVNATAQRIDANVTLTDPDTGGFAGGSVQVIYDGADPGTSADQLGVGSFDRITVTGTNVFYDIDDTVGVNNVLIGTIDGVLNGVNGNALEIDLNGAATVEAVEALIEALTYQNTSNNPNATRTIQVTFNDGDTGTTTQETQITITPANDAPIVSGLTDTLQYSGTTTVVIDTNVTVTDDDSPDFNGGSLVVNYNGGSGAATETISIDTSGVFSISGTTLRFFDGVTNQNIGTITSTGLAGAPLSINFTSALVTPALVQELLRSLNYANTANPPTAGSSLRFILSDGDGGTTTDNKPINFAPVLANLTNPLAYSGTTPSQIDADVTLTDPDSADFIGGVLTVQAVGGANNDLSIDTSGLFALVGTTLSYNGNNIATVAGLNTDTLTVTFNTAFATTPAVQDLLRALQYARTTGAAGTLDLNFTLTDGDGGTTGLITKPVNIT